MMQWTPTTDFDAAYALLEASFPPVERRTEEGQRALLSRPEYRLLACRADGETLALLAEWRLNHFVFVEHFAVVPGRRGGGLGGRLLEQYLAGVNAPVILEVEPPQTEIAKRRIGFYQRHGFVLNAYAYLQPPLRAGAESIPLLLMSYPHALDLAEFVTARQALRAAVYGVQGSFAK